MAHLSRGFMGFIFTPGVKKRILPTPGIHSENTYVLRTTRLVIVAIPFARTAYGTPLELYQGYDEVRKTYTRYHIYEFFPRGTLEDAVKLKYQHLEIETLIGLVSAVSCLHQSLKM